MTTKRGVNGKELPSFNFIYKIILKIYVLRHIIQIRHYLQKKKHYLVHVRRDIIR